MKDMFKILYIIPLLFCFCFSFFSYKSSLAQRQIVIDLKKKNKTFKFSDIDNMLNGFPNINSAALPNDIWRVQYSLLEKNYSQAKKYVKSAANVNPHVYVSEYLQGIINLGEGKLDSAFYYSKKAFEGWPKNIQHYNSYVDVLEAKQDSTSLIKAYAFLDSTLKNRPEYFKRFYKSFNKIKLSYLVTNFDDEIDLNYSKLVGNTFIRGYNFPNGQVIKDTTMSYTFVTPKIIKNQNGAEFNYKLKKDTLLFFYKRDSKTPIAKYYAKYSPEYKTLIFRNIEYEKDKFQDQFFIKSQ